MSVIPFIGMVSSAAGIIAALLGSDPIMAGVGVVIFGANAWLAFYA